MKNPPLNKLDHPSVRARRARLSSLRLARLSSLRLARLSSLRLGRLSSLRLALVVALVLCAAVARAQQPTARPGAQPRQITQTQADLYERWRANINTNQQAAFEAGRDYLTKYPGDEYASYVSRWVTAYERAARRHELARSFKAQDYAGVFRAGRLILADEPDDLKTISHLAYAGYLAAAKGDDSHAAESLDYARRAISSIESGAQPADWQPFVDRPDALAYLNFVVGELTFRDDPASAASLYLKALSYDSTLRRAPAIYSRLAAAYVAARYDPLSKDYESRYSGKEATDESRAALEKIQGVVDLIIDSYARAVALSPSDPQYAEAKRRWMDELTRFYKFRHDDSTEGLDALINTVASKPLPENKG